MPHFFYRKAISTVVLLCFSLFTIVVPAGSQITPILNFGLTTSFQPPVLRGMMVHPENPLLFDFIVDRGQEKIGNNLLKDESTKLIKYFLTSMTIPDKDAWVNLSPFEKDRIIPDALGQTEMGRQMLEQDYVLKQLAASLTNPDTELGKRYWDEVNRVIASEAKQSLKNEIASSLAAPRNDNSRIFSKVWIVPDGATVVEKDGFAYITESKLTVMLDIDYGSQNLSSPHVLSGDPLPKIDSRFRGNDIEKLSTQVFREMILPKLIEEVNTGKNFAATRQVYQSVILAAWYKRALKDSLLGRIYADKSKIEGVETDVKDIKQKVYEQYLEAFKKGAYNVIKEEDGPDGETIPRKYFSGGTSYAEFRPKIVRGSSAINGVEVAINNAGDKFALVAASGVEVKTGEKEAVAGASPISGVYISKLARALTFALAAVMSANTFGQSLNSATLYLGDQDRHRDGTSRVENVLEAQEQLKITLDKWVKTLEKRYGTLVPDIIQAPQLKILLDGATSFNDVAGRIKTALDAKKSDKDALTKLQEQVARWVYVFIRNNTRYNQKEIEEVERGQHVNFADLRKTFVGNPSYDGQETIVCESAVYTALMIFHDFGFSLETDDVSAMEIIKDYFGRVYSSEKGSVDSTVGHTALKIIFANRSVWLMDFTMGPNEYNYHVDHQQGRNRYGEIVSLTGKNLLYEPGLNIDDLLRQQNNFKVMNQAHQYINGLKIDFNQAIALMSTGEDTKARVIFENLLQKIEQYLSNHKARELTAIRWYDIYQTISGLNAPYGGRELIAQLKDLRRLAAVNIEYIANGKNTPAAQKETLVKMYDSFVNQFRKISDVNSREVINQYQLLQRQIALILKNNSSMDPVIKENFEKFLSIVEQIIKLKEAQLVSPPANAVLTIPNAPNFISSLSSSDANDSAVGGIDFNPTNMSLQIKRDGRGVPLPLPQQDLENININGLYPVIINILPVNAQTLPILGQLDVQPNVKISKS